MPQPHHPRAKSLSQRHIRPCVLGSPGTVPAHRGAFLEFGPHVTQVITEPVTHSQTMWQKNYPESKNALDKALRIPQNIKLHSRLN